MSQETIETFKDYINKIGNRIALYKTVARKYKIKSAIYPGSHVDILPSFVIPKVTYIDNFKGSIKFFKDMDTIKKYVQENKIYEEASYLQFIGKDYSDSLDIEKVDLIISQYAGFVGQATKKYLKKDGILLCNDSHGDATLAQFDDDFELVGVLDTTNKIIIDNLESYFKLPKDKVIDLNYVKTKMRGLNYSSNAENYLFRKTN